MIESWWRTLKHQWLFLNDLDSVRSLRGLVDYYVTAHNTQLPHSAFRGQTPDEMYFGTGEAVPTELVAKKTQARQARLEVNRSAVCDGCPSNEVAA